jgi:aspartate aminotransferase
MAAPQTPRELSFGDDTAVDGSLSERVRGLVGSEILKIGAEVRQLVREGRPVCNLTVGDFNSGQFPIPGVLLDHVRKALEAGETNYPPSDGVLALRQAVVEHVARTQDVRYPVESVLIAGGARPLLYAAYRCVLNPGDKVVYPVPSWNNNHYAWISAAKAVEIATRVQDGFMPTVAQIEPHLGDAQMVCINSPLNPTGTVMAPEQLGALTRAVVEENERRTRRGGRHLFLLHDQVYGALTFGDARHVHPVSLVPEAAPWVISLDAISKVFAATGLRVGWVLAAPAVTARIRDLIGHVGAWAPRAEQVAVAAFLRDEAAVRAFGEEMSQRVRTRLEALYSGFTAMKDQGYPVECVYPQGAIYLSLRLALSGRSFRGRSLDTNEAIRRLLLEQAGVAVVPFQAFGLREDSGWFRLSVGAVSLEDIEQAFPRLRSLLDALD